MQPNESDCAIVTEQLCRSFSGKPALVDCSLRVPRGSIYGFLGRNGSGKTTAIKILAGLIRPDSGSVRVLGKDPQMFTPLDRQKIGYVSEKQILPLGFKVYSLIKLCASLHSNWNHGLVSDLLGRFRIDPHKRINALSQGTQRQVAFMLALAQRPELLILDEPASTLDTVARREFLDEILVLIRESGVTVFFSSHILSDVERVADQVGILANGKMVVSESLDDLKESVKRVRFHSFAAGINGFTVPEAFCTTKLKDEVVVTARVNDEADLAEIARIAGAQYEITDLPLEEIFIELSRH